MDSVLRMHSAILKKKSVSIDKNIFSKRNCKRQLQEAKLSEKRSGYVFNSEFTYIAGHQVAEFTVFAFKFGQIHCKPICLGHYFIEYFEKIDF
jgi:hypothetical protein